MMNKILILYLPVFHRGYLDMLGRHNDADLVWVIGDCLLEKLDPVLFRKDLRRLSPFLATQMLVSLGIISGKIEILDNLTEQEVDQLRSADTVVLNEDEIMRKLVEETGCQEKAIFDGAFLRWDRKRIKEMENPSSDRLVTRSDMEYMRLAQAVRSKSPDWWLQVGAVIVGAKCDGLLSSPLVGWNLHPGDGPNRDGDPRYFCQAGESLEISLAEHAEASLIATAARRGLSLEGAHLYVTTFPCLPCARLIVRAGIQRCYFHSGYSSLGGLEVLKSSGVEIIKVDNLG